MHRQLFLQRLASGFPHDGVRVAGKSGTFGAVRHEVGVVTLPGGAAFAIAVFTLAARGDVRQPRVDTAIGEAARLVGDVRQPRVDTAIGEAARPAVDLLR